MLWEEESLSIPLAVTRTQDRGSAPTAGLPGDIWELLPSASATLMG